MYSLDGIYSGLSFTVCSSGDYGVLFHTSKTHTLAIFYLGGELALFLLCTLLRVYALSILLQRVS